MSVLCFKPTFLSAFIQLSIQLSIQKKRFSVSPNQYIHKLLIDLTSSLQTVRHEY